tara:strand:- start:482 stop:874 length:393 start_codon:yes stop_codon:yes gene_type:complete
MSKVSPCPNCETEYIVVIHNSGTNTVRVECWKCEYAGSDKYKNYLIIDANEYLEDGELQVQGKGEILKYASDLWNEVVGMEKIEENLDTPNSYDENNYNFDQWYDITTDDLIEDEQEEELFSDKADNSKK